MRNSISVGSFVGAVAVTAVVAAATAVAARQAPAPAVIVPHESWSCGLPDGIPAPESGALLFTAEMPLERVADIGRTQYGRRQVAVVREGTFTGSRVSGTVMTGALDFELTLANGVVEIEQIFVLRTADGKYIHVRTAGTGADAKDVRVVMDFEAPNASDAAWLNSGTYVARRVLNAAAKTMTLRVYDVSGFKAPANAPGAIVSSSSAAANSRSCLSRRGCTR
jgi:hypothetical protein